MKLEVFELVQSDDMYRDFERAALGFGSDGKARVERLTRCLEDNTFYAGARHIEPCGADTYEATSESGLTAREAIAWLSRNREVAPI